MKRLFAAGVVLLLIIGVCVAEHFVTNNFETQFDKYITLIKSEKDKSNHENCEKYSNEMIDLFEKSETILILFSDKDMVDDIERAVYRIKDYNKSEDTTLFYSEISVLETEIKELKRSSGLFLSSVF